MKKNIDRTLVVKNILANIRVLAIVVACLTVLGVGNVLGAVYTYDFSTVNNFYTTKGGNTHPSSGSSNKFSNGDSFYAADGAQFTVLYDEKVYFSTGYIMVGNQSPVFQLPTYSGEKITQVKFWNSSGCSTSVRVTIKAGSSTASAEQTWSTQSTTYTYSIGTDYQASTLKLNVVSANAQITKIEITTTSTCDKSVTVSNGGSSTNGSITSITTSPVATCSSTASDRRVSIVVTPSTGYVAPTDLSVGTSTGTVTSTKVSRTDNGNGTFTFVYGYNQNDNGTISYNAACVGKQCTLIFNQNSGTGGQTSNLTATYGSAMPAISGVPTREHYDFEGYYDGVGGTGNKYYNSDGTSATNWNKNTTANTTLYAKWTEHSLINYRTVCCTPLGEIDGTIALTNEDCDPGELKATWKMTATTGIASQTLKVYDENLDEVTAKRITGITASTSNQTKTISGLDPCKEYFVTVENVSSGGVYCAAQSPWDSNVETTLGYTYTVNATNCQLKSTSDPVPSDMCEGDVLVYYEATGGSTLPDAITVTNAGDENVGWAWDNSDGSLMIDADAVTGNVTVTIFASCPDYSFHYGNDGDDASLWTITCFEKVKPLDATDHEWKLEDFTIPSKTDFYVGYQGSFKGSDNLGTGGASSATKKWTATPTYSTDHWDGAMILAPNDGYTYGSYAVGQATGATGTITIYDDSNSDNLFAEFEPDGYGISYSTSSYAFGDATSHVRETEVVTLPNVSTTYAIGLATATEGTYVKCAHSKSSDEAISAIGVTEIKNNTKRILFNPSGAGDTYDKESAKIALYSITGDAFIGFMTKVDGIYEGYVPTTCTQIIISRHASDAATPTWENKHNQSNDITLPTDGLQIQYNFNGWAGDGKKETFTTTAIHPTTGQTGKFRMIDNDKNQNWNVRFVPYYKLSYDANGGSGSTAAATRDSESSTQTVTVASNGFTAPTGYSFAGWATSDDGTAEYAAGDSYTLNDDATLYAVWEANTISLTLSKNNSDASGSSDGSASVIYDGTTLTSISHATRTGYSIEGYYGESGCTTKVLEDDGDFADDDVSGFIDGGKWNNATSPTTLYTKWTANSYTVTLDNNDATSGSQQTVSATYASAMPLKTTSSASVAALSRTGYTFTGWWDATSGGNQYYSYDGSSISSARNWDKASNTTLKAQWSVNSYTLTWSWNGGSTSSTTHTAAGSVAYGTTLVYPANNTMSKTGHSFTGWSSTPSTMPATNTTITAQWSVNNYNVAVLANSNVTITATPSGSSAIAESGNANVNYGTTVTLNYSSLGSGLTWGGWKVYKADDANTTVTVSGTGNGATFTLPAYDVKVEAFIYSAGIAWCDPEIEVTGDIHLTSYKNIPVYSTEDAENLISISSSDFGSATRLEVAYLDADNADAEVDKAESVFRFCSSADYSTIDGLDLDHEWGTTHSIRYTPNAYNKRDNYKLQLILKRGDHVLKTVTHNIYGRALPQEFVIASKYNGHWYALPNTMGTATETVTPIQITVDNATTPTKASYAPSTTVYKGAARKTETSNRNSIRLTNDGSHWLITNNSNAQLGLSATETDGYENREVWYLKSSTFGAYTLKMDPAQTPGNKQLGINSDNGRMGMYASGTVGTSGDIYLLPIDTKYTPIDATATDWMKDIIGVTASTSATKMGIAKENGTEYAAVTLASEETSHVADFDGEIDFTGLTGEKLLLKWYDGSTLVGGSQVTVPSIILAGSNTTWSALETAIEKSTTLDDIVVLSKPMTVGDAHAKAKQIVMDQSGDNTGKLTIDPSKGLEVAGTVKVYDGSAFGASTENDLVLESSEDDGNASLIFNNSNACQATVQQYSKAAIVGDTWNWQYVGTPFTGSIPGYNYYGSWMYKWDKTDGWLVVHGGDELTPFAGYCLTQESATTHVMGGTLVATDGNDQTITMGEETDMVLANSWTAPIWIGGFTAETFTSKPATIYLFNTGSAENGSSAGTTEAGTYNAVPVNTGSYVGTELIPSMQGFFVTTNGDGGKEGTITLKYDELVRPDKEGYRTSITTGQMYAPRRAKAVENKPAVMKIMANGSKYSDRVVILERTDFSNGFDNGWDGEKLSFGAEAPSVYVINEQGGYDAVSAIPSLEGTVVGFRAGTNDSCTISFEFDGDETLYLNDLQAQQSTLIDAEQTYTFSTSGNDNEARFIISATPIQQMPTSIDNGGLMNDGMVKVRKIIINDKLFIIRGGRMYSAEGQMVK